MPSTAKRVGEGETRQSARILLIDSEAPSASRLTKLLAGRGYSTSQVEDDSGAESALDRGEISLVLVVDRPRGVDLRQVCSVAAERGAPVMVVTEGTPDAPAAIERLASADDWVSLRHVDEELPSRVARLLLRRKAATALTPAERNPPGPKLDAEFFSLVVHDLRNPLNVITLSIRMIRQALPKEDPELEEDLRFLEENFRQVDWMLSQLGDYLRLFERSTELTVSEFSPRRMVEEFLETRALRGGAKQSSVVIDAQESCPAVVSLDHRHARAALQYALANATAAAVGHPIRLVLRGGPERLVIEIAIDHPPPQSVKSTTLSPRSFERLTGFAAERRGMDLAIAARVSELFGGTARLDLAEGQGTVVVLDWPASLPSS